MSDVPTRILHHIKVDLDIDNYVAIDLFAQAWNHTPGKQINRSDV